MNIEDAKPNAQIIYKLLDNSHSYPQAKQRFSLYIEYTQKTQNNLNQTITIMDALSSRHLIHCSCNLLFVPMYIIRPQPFSYQNTEALLEKRGKTFNFSYPADALCFQNENARYPRHVNSVPFV